MENPTISRRLCLARRLLQTAIALGALVPILAGFAGVFMGPNMIHDGGIMTTSMDSHFRYLSGLLAGIGIGFWTTIPDIENKTSRIRLLAAIVVLGGLGRLISLLLVGIPDHSMLFGLVMELFVVPLITLWQSLISRQCRASH